VHDELGYNYRLPNINAALGCAQLELLEDIVASKRELAARYAAHFSGSDFEFITEPANCRSNYWLNAVICNSRETRDNLLKITNDKGVMTRPIWALMSHLPMYTHCRKGDLSQAEWFEARVVNLPSSVLPK
jgi:dTDP-4-amino-4,6-dideoxygalactose transaminase